MDKLGIFTCSFQGIDENKDPISAVKMTAGLGLHNAELYPYPQFEGEAGLEYAKEVRAVSDSLGVQHCCFSYGGSLHNETAEQVLASMRHYIHIAAILGSPYFHHTLALPITRGKNYPPLLADVYAPVMDKARQLCDTAQEYGLGCLYEDQGYLFNGVQVMERFISEIDRPNAGINIDLGNILFVDEKPEVYTGRFAGIARHVHIKDYIFKPASTHNTPGSRFYQTRSGNYLRGVPIGHGIVDFVSCFKILKQCGYEGAYCIEFDGMESPIEAVKESINNFNRFMDIAERELGDGPQSI